MKTIDIINHITAQTDALIKIIDLEKELSENAKEVSEDKFFFAGMSQAFDTSKRHVLRMQDILVNALSEDINDDGEVES